MTIRDMVKPALLGALAGGAIVLWAGFGMGILVIANAARDQATMKAAAAVADVMTPYCVAAAHADPAYTALFEEMKSQGGYARTQIVRKAGWATPLGAKSSDATLADVCQAKLMAEG